MYRSQLTVTDHAEKKASLITQGVLAKPSVCYIRPWDRFALQCSKRLQYPATGMPALTSPCLIFHPITLTGPVCRSPAILILCCPLPAIIPNKDVAVATVGVNRKEGGWAGTARPGAVQAGIK